MAALPQFLALIEAPFIVATTLFVATLPTL